MTYKFDLVTKPASYPFLAIANKYGVDYAKVLQVADRYKHGIERIVDDSPLLNDIWIAGLLQQAIRDGVIDWNTGLPVAVIHKEH